MTKKFVALISILFLPLLLVTPVFAQEFAQGETVSLQKSQVIDGDYFAAGRQVSINGTVTGDAYVAGGNVLFDGIVNGDLLVAGGTVNIQGHVAHDLRVAGGNVVVSGTVDGNVTAVGGNVQIDKNAKLGGSLVSTGGSINVLTPVKNGATLAGGAVTIDNSVGGNVSAATSQLSLTSNAVINGDLKYWSRNDAVIDPSAKITGNTFHYLTAQNPAPSPSDWFGAIAVASIPFKILSFLGALVVGLLLLYFAPRFTSATSDRVLGSYWQSLLVGFVGVIVIPIALLIIMVTIIGLPLALILLALFLIELYLSHIVISLAAGRKIFQLLGAQAPQWQMYLAGLLVYSIVTLIPLLGAVVWLLAGFLGFGAILLAKRDFYRQFTDKKLL